MSAVLYISIYSVIVAKKILTRQKPFPWLIADPCPVTFIIYRRYNNKVSQDPGWNSEILEWRLLEAKERNLKEQDYWGGFVIDEMKIQLLNCL